MRAKGLVICALAVGAAAMAGAAFGQGANQGLNIAIATGGTGGVYYPLGGGMANVLSKYVPGVQATARVVLALERIERGVNHHERDFALLRTDQFEIVDRAAGRRVASSSKMMKMTPSTTSRWVGMVARSVNSSPPSMA